MATRSVRSKHPSISLSKAPTVDIDAVPPEDAVEYHNDVLSMVYECYGETKSPVPVQNPQFEVITELNNAHFLRRVSSHDIKGTEGPHMLIGEVEPQSLFETAKGLGYVSSKMRSCYYSSWKGKAGTATLEIWYNLLENHTVSPIHLRVNDATNLERLHEPVYFSYSMESGRSTYLLSRTDPANLASIKRDGLPRLHPFTFHVALISREIEKRSEPMADLLNRILVIEEKLLFKPLQDQVPTRELSRSLQELHKIARLFIVSEHRTGRDLSNIKNLLRDLNRFAEFEKLAGDMNRPAVDWTTHERIKDAFLSLQDVCENILRRLTNRLKRVKNLIALLYSLLATQDSRTNVLMAWEMRKDSSAMKTIATMTLIFLPATFISSIFGTNFFSMGGSDGFVVSHLWWILLASGLSLTIVVSVLFWAYTKWRLGMRKPFAELDGGESVMEDEAAEEPKKASTWNM